MSTPPESQSPPRDRRRLLAYGALAVGVITLAFSGIFVKLADAPGVVSAFYRLGLGALLMTLPMAHEQRRRPHTRTGIVWSMVAGVFFAADIGLWTTGVVMSGVVNPTLLSNTAPVWVGLAALVVFRESLNRRFWFGLLVALTGAALVMGLDALADVQVGLGSLLGLISGIFYAGYFVAVQIARRTLSSVATSWWGALGAALALAAALVVLRIPFTGYDRFTVALFIAAAVVVQVIGYSAVNYAIGVLPASLVAPTLLGQPVLMALLAWPLLGERVSPLQGVAGALVLAGIYLVHRSRTTPPRRARAPWRPTP